jgi:ABC-type Mn2+/Zn2+ transport system ATPase subunit
VLVIYLEFLTDCLWLQVLWTELTARDHLEVRSQAINTESTIALSVSEIDCLWLQLYARFKGTDPKDLTKAVDMVLSSVALLENGDQPVRNFSGGMKRRLSVGISMIGSPQIIFLYVAYTSHSAVARGPF